MGNNGVANGTLSLYSDDANQEVTLSPNSSMTSTVGFILPKDDGNNAQALLTDGTGSLYWGTAGDDGDWTVSGNDMYSKTSITNVGINTGGPAATTLEVNGTGSFSGDVTVMDGSISINNSAATAGSLTFQEPSGSGGEITTFSATAQDKNIHYTLPSDDGDEGEVLMSDGSGVLFWGLLDDSDWVIDGAGTEMYSNTSITNVGIGTESPNANALLDVNGVASFSDTVTMANSSGQTTSFSTSATQIDNSIEYVWPAKQGASGSVTTMTNDGDGNLSWMTAGDLDKTKNVEVITNNDYTADNDDYYIIVKTSASYTVTLPANPDKGKVYFIKAIGDDLAPPDEVIIDGGGIRQIDGSPSLTISGDVKESVMLLSDGNNWFIMSRYKEE